VPRACILGCAGPDLGAEEAAFLRDADPWGFILFARNVATPDRLHALTNGLREAVGRAAPVLIDQEGGRVDRLGGDPWTSWDPPLDMMDMARDPVRAMHLRAAIIAAELRGVGIDVNCTPTADIASDATHPFLLNRTYGRSVDEVSTRARANAEGCLAGGVLPVLKHIPGHGRGTVDSHLAVPRVSASLDVLDATDFEVFRRLADLPLGMSAHVIFEALDDRPGTISPVVLDRVRGAIGFDGLLMTDDISMGALPGGMAERGAAALAAGCDLVLHCNAERAEMEALLAVLPPLEGVASRRAARALAVRPPGPTLDIEDARAELRALIP
jgi:beta-N-acetylhexosaminidase